jgi:hypothetical protein
MTKLFRKKSYKRKSYKKNKKNTRKNLKGGTPTKQTKQTKRRTVRKGLKKHEQRKQNIINTIEKLKQSSDLKSGEELDKIKEKLTSLKGEVAEEDVVISNIETKLFILAMKLKKGDAYWFSESLNRYTTNQLLELFSNKQEFYDQMDDELKYLRNDDDKHELPEKTTSKNLKKILDWVYNASGVYEIFVLLPNYERAYLRYVLE